MDALAPVFFTAALGFGIGYVHWGKRMAREQRQTIGRRHYKFGNYLDLCFRSHRALTGEGLRARRRFLVCLFGILVSILLGLLAAGLFRRP